MISKLKFAILLLAITGCNLNPRYKAPQVVVPEKWKGEQTTPTEKIVCKNWWDLFGDEKLSSLLNEVIVNNHDIKSAYYKIIEARAIAGYVRGDLFPHLTFNPSYQNTNEALTLYGVPSNLFPGLKTVTRANEFQYNLPLMVNYEIDIWRRITDSYYAALYNAEAEQEAYHGSILSLTTELASNYYNIRALDEELILTKETLDLQGEVVEIKKKQFLRGLINNIDLMNAETAFLNQEAAYQNLVNQRNLFENAIAVLIGKPAPEFHFEKSPLKEKPPTVPLTLPSSILLQRPDVRKAERDMASVYQLIGVAYASFLPSLKISGGVGLATQHLHHFFSWQKNKLWQLGANVLQTIFDGQKNRSKLQLARAGFLQAEENYKSTILTALQEVENALSSVSEGHKQTICLEGAVLTTEKTAEISSARYEKGLTTRLEALSTRQQELNARSAYINQLVSEYQSTIQLIKAIGGSFDQNGSS